MSTPPRLVALLLAAAVTAAAEDEAPRFAGAFGDRMILQRDAALPVWGTAAAGRAVEVALGEVRQQTRADVRGRWRVVLPPQAASAQARDLRVSAGGEALCRDVLVGDVWLVLASGRMTRAMFTFPKDGLRRQAAGDAGLRLRPVETYAAAAPIADLNPASWRSGLEDDLGLCPVSLFLGRQLRARQDVPVGLVLVNLERFLPWEWAATDRGSLAAALGADGVVAAQLPQDIAAARLWAGRVRSMGESSPLPFLDDPASLRLPAYERRRGRTSLAFNAMIHPLAPFALRGVALWLETDERIKSPADAGELAGRTLAGWSALWGRERLPVVIGLHAPASPVAAADGAMVVPVAGLPAAQWNAPFLNYRDAWAGIAGACLAVPAPGPELALPRPGAVPPRPPPSAAPPVASRLALSALFAPGMVLQRDRSVPVWGRGTPGRRVTLSFGGQSVGTTVAPDGSWRLSLAAMPASAEPRVLRVRSEDEAVEASDVLVGEVWISCGQSNAEFAMAGSRHYAEEAPKAAHPHIRWFKAAAYRASLPVDEPRGAWTVCSPETVGQCSAQAYHAAEVLHARLGVPIGMLNLAMMGTDIVSWNTPEGLAGQPTLVVEAESCAANQRRQRARLPGLADRIERWANEAEAALRDGDASTPAFPVDDWIFPNRYSWVQNRYLERPATCFNAIVAPVVGYAVRGMLWNQGEGDANWGSFTADGLRGGHGAYADEMTGMVASWRRRWGQGEFPVYFVQLPAIATVDLLPRMWQAQTSCLARIPSCGMVATSDISEPDAAFGTALHPTNKRDLGRRLAAWALARTYGVPDVVYSGPFYRSSRLDGSQVVVSFDYAHQGLRTRDGKPATCFELADGSGRFSRAEAVIGSDSVTLSAAGILAPTRVRLGWSPGAQANLINGKELPALPFEHAVGDEQTNP